MPLAYEATVLGLAAAAGAERRERAAFQRGIATEKVWHRRQVEFLAADGMLAQSLAAFHKKPNLNFKG